MKNHLLLASLSLIACSPKPATTPEPVSKPKEVIAHCSKISGKWTGKHFYDSAEVLSRYEIVYNGDNTLEMAYTTQDNLGGIKNETYTGTWHCNNNQLETNAKDSSGVEHTYKYEILAISDTGLMTYKNTYPNEFGETFEATKHKSAAK